MGNQNFFFVPRSWQDEKTFSGANGLIVTDPCGSNSSADSGLLYAMKFLEQVLSVRLCQNFPPIRKTKYFQGFQLKIQAI